MATGVGCASLPPPGQRTVTQALADTGSTRLGQAIAPLAAAHSGLPGVLALPDGRDAFAARVLLLLDELRSAAERGVRVLINSLEATDVAVHAGHAKWRHDLLRAGVSLFELRRSGGGDLPDSGRGRFGSSASSLHAKTFGIDDRSIFVGSFNMDQRATDLNTEMGLVIHSARIAQELNQVVDNRMRERAYEVRLDESGKLFWDERADGKTLRHDTEPGTGNWERAEVQILSILPSTGCCRKFRTGLAKFAPGSL